MTERKLSSENESRFDYLIKKIEGAPISSTPFIHLEIQDFFNDDDFVGIVSAPEVQINNCKSDEALLSSLFDNGYKMVPFPGATTNVKEYLHKRKTRQKFYEVNSACESQGVVLRLQNSQSTVIRDLCEFINSPLFLNAIARKFDINLNSCSSDTGLQKYLDGYEISPHPDIRKKAATFMININPHQNTETAEHHTSYLKFKAEKTYIQEYWRGNPHAERFWVPWDWCDTVKVQSRNNSFVAFAPSHNTMHAVKAQYDHLQYQRTQLYGNLWYSTDFKAPTEDHNWERYSLPNDYRPAVFPKVTAKLKSTFDKFRFKKLSHQIDVNRRNNY